MTKRKYLRRLRKALGRTPEREKEELIEYYAEIIDESYEHGKTTNEIFATLETPEQAASDYFSANEGRMNERRRRPSHDEYFSRGRDDDYFDDRRFEDRPPRRYREPRANKTPPKKRSVWLTALLFPIWLPLLIVLVVLGLAISIVVVTLLIVDVVLVVSFALAGLYCLVMSFGLFPQNGMIALTQIGAAFIFFGLAVLFELTVKPLGKGVGAYFRLVFRRQPAGGAVAQTHWVRTMAAGIAFLMIGAAMGAVGFGSLDWNWQNLAVTGEFTQKERIIETDGTALSIKATNLALNVVAAEDETAKLVYTESAELPMEYSCENGVTSLRWGSWNKFSGGEYWKETWRRGILLSTVMSLKANATLYVPASFSGELSADVDNGQITLRLPEESAINCTKLFLKADNGRVFAENVKAGSVEAITNNGMVELSGVSANSVRAESDNGMVLLRGVIAGQITGDTSNGYIKCERVSGDEITLSTNNGAVSGTIVGTLEQFRIFAKVQNGKCNLANRDTGDKSLSVKTSNGSINLQFEM